MNEPQRNCIKQRKPDTEDNISIYMKCLEKANIEDQGWKLGLPRRCHKGNF